MSPGNNVTILRQFCEECSVSTLLLVFAWHEWAMISTF